MQQLAARCRQVAKINLTATCGKLPQDAVNLPSRLLLQLDGNLPSSCRQVAVKWRRQVAATCRKMPSSCKSRLDGKLPQVAASCRAVHFDATLTASCRKLPQLAAGAQQVAASCRKMPWGADGNLRQVAVNPASGKLGASGGVCFLSSPLHDHRKRPSTATCGNLPHAARGILRQVAASCREWISSKKFSRAESSSEAETSSGAGSLLFPAHGKLPQVAVNLRFRRRQVAASCRKLP